MRKSTVQVKEDRLSVRANPEQKELLARAAQARHMNTSQFVLQTSLMAAKEILEGESNLILSPSEFEWLTRLMDAPAAEAPRLRESLKQPPVWNG